MQNRNKNLFGFFFLIWLITHSFFPPIVISLDLIQKKAISDLEAKCIDCICACDGMQLANVFALSSLPFYFSILEFIYL